MRAIVVLTTTCDAIFMEPRELRLRIFHLPHRCVAPLSPGNFLPPTTSARLIVPALFTSTPKLHDRRDRSVPSPRGKSARKEGRKSAPSRSYESYATVSAADRMKKKPRRESIRMTGRSGKFRPFFVERKRSRIPPLSPSFHCSFVKLKQWYATLFSPARSRAMQ